MTEPRSMRISNQARWADNPSVTQQPSIKRIAPDPPQALLNISQETSVGQANTTSDERHESREIRQAAQETIQNDTPTGTNRRNLNFRTRGVNEGPVVGSTAANIVTSPLADTTTGGSGKGATMLLNKQSGMGPSLSEIRKRLIEQGRVKGGFAGDAGQTFNNNTPNLGLTAGNTTHNSPENAHQVTPLDRVRQRLGSGDQGGKPANDFKNVMETPPPKHQNDAVGPGDATKHALPQTIHTKTEHDEAIKSHFSDRLQSGELDKVTKGEIAQKLKLADQYRLMQQGNVARRMELHKHAGDGANIKIHDFKHSGHVDHLKNVTDFYASRPHYYHGGLSPHYVDSCFNFFYNGPSFFAGVCWYPHWDPWVAWSWHYHCRPLWDPRPLWCQPVIYEPYYDWAWWETPVWAPLPAATCGTWVEVERPVVPATQYDLQLLAVRFVDPGHPEEKLGPRYRVWLRNNSDQPITTPFNVMLFAGNDDKLTANLPHSGLRVTSIEPGTTQSVDIRLPLEAATMGRDAQGNPAPYQYVHVLLDANQEIAETTRNNNGAIIPRGDVLPVDPAAFEVDPTSTAVGSELILAGEGFGPQPGQVLIHVADQELPAEVLGWYDLGVRVSVPQIELKEPTPAEVIVVRGDGAAANPIKITLLPGQIGPALSPPPPPAPAQ